MTIKPDDVITDGSAQWRVRKIGDANPVGTIVAFAGHGTIPQGYLTCDGSILNSDDYPALFAVIGQVYGGEIGTKQFALPQLTDSSYLRGDSVAGEKQTAGLPALMGTQWVNGNGTWSSGKGSGAFKNDETSPEKKYLYAPASSSSGQDYLSALKFDASAFNHIYGASTTVRPRNLSVRFIIKY